MIELLRKFNDDFQAGVMLEEDEDDEPMDDDEDGDQDQEGSEGEDEEEGEIPEEWKETIERDVLRQQDLVARPLSDAYIELGGQKLKQVQKNKRSVLADPSSVLAHNVQQTLLSMGVSSDGLFW